MVIGSLHYYDRLYIRWGCTDRAVAERFANELDHKLAEASRVADQIVVVTHHLPFREGWPQDGTAVTAYLTPFMGSGRLGNVIQRYPKVTTVIHGHSHNDNDMVYTVGRIRCYSCNATARLIELPSSH